MTETTKPWSSPRHQVSPLNYAPEVRAEFEFREPVVVQDFTFGKIERLFGSRLYTADEYLEIGRLLDELRVTETAFLTGRYRGTPREDAIWRGFRAVAKLRRKHLKVRGFVFIEYIAPNTWREEVDRVLADGADAIYFHFYPIGVQRFAREFEDRRHELAEAFEYASSRNATSALAISNAPGDELAPLVNWMNYCLDHGVGGFELSDTVGRTTPESTRHFIRSLRRGLKRDVPIWYHAHNNLGLGTALALAATTAGAWPQAAAAGIGDNGFASLEEVVVALELLYGVRTGVDMSRLTDLARTVERITGIRNPPYKAVTGEHVALHEVEHNYIGTLQGKTHLELLAGPFALEMVGQQGSPQLAMSYAALRDDVVQEKLQHLGLPTDPTVVARTRDALRRALDAVKDRYPILLAEPEVDRICKAAAKGTA